MPFYFTLRKRTKRLAEAYIKESIKKQVKQEDVIKKWVKGESNFNKADYLEVWENYRKIYGDKILHQALKSMAIGNALVDANHILQYNMGMPQASIEQGPVVALIGKLFNVELATILLEDTGINTKAKEEIMQRVVAKDFPLRHEKTPIEQKPPIINTPLQLPSNNTRRITRGEN